MSTYAALHRQGADVTSSRAPRESVRSASTSRGRSANSRTPARRISTTPQTANSSKRPGYNHSHERALGLRSPVASSSAASSVLNGAPPGVFSQPRTDALSGEIFRSKLQAIMSVREQIEALAAKHKDEEAALASVINSLRFDDEASPDDRKQAQNQLVAAVLERDRTIEMLDTFRKEGNAVIHRMHENLRTTAAQNEQLAKRLEEQNKELEELRAQVGSGRTIQDPSFAAAQNQRIDEYTTLLAEADQVIVDLREQNEALHLQIRSKMAIADESASPSRASAGASPSAEHLELQRLVDELRDQLRSERRQRLQIEEQSERIWSAQQRQIALLEQRLAAEKRSGGTPRSARAGARRGSAATVIPTSNPPADGILPVAAASNSVIAGEPSVRPPSPLESRDTAAPSPAIDITDSPEQDPGSGDRDDASDEAHAESMIRIEELQRQLCSLQKTLHP